MRAEHPRRERHIAASSSTGSPLFLPVRPVTISENPARPVLLFEKNLYVVRKRPQRLSFRRQPKFVTRPSLPGIPEAPETCHVSGAHIVRIWAVFREQPVLNQSRYIPFSILFQIITDGFVFSDHIALVDNRARIRALRPNTTPVHDDRILNHGKAVNLTPQPNTELITVPPLIWNPQQQLN